MFKRFTEAVRTLCAYRIGRAAIMYGIYLALCLLGSRVAFDFMPVARLSPLYDSLHFVGREVAHGTGQAELEYVWVEGHPTVQVVKRHRDYGWLFAHLFLVVLPYFVACAWAVTKTPRKRLFWLSFAMLVYLMSFMTGYTLYYRARHPFPRATQVIRGQGDHEAVVSPSGSDPGN